MQPFLSNAIIFCPTQLKHSCIRQGVNKHFSSSDLLFYPTLNAENRSQIIKIKETMILDPLVLESYLYFSNTLFVSFLKSLSKSKAMFINPILLFYFLIFLQNQSPCALTPA